MRVIFAKKKSIVDQMNDAMTKADLLDEKIDTFYLKQEELDEFISEVKFMNRPGDIQYFGVKVKLIPAHDIFYDGDYWVEHGFVNISSSADFLSLDFNNTHVILDGKYYRKVE